MRQVRSDELGCRVIEAVSGRATLEQLEERPDITLMVADHLMPGMSGGSWRHGRRPFGRALRLVLVSGRRTLEQLAFR
jgi:CheY-like chemotaxis protein